VLCDQSMDETSVSQKQQKGQGEALPQQRARRTCIGCKAQGGRHDLLRFVCTPAREVILDVSGHAPGRGVYVCHDVQCLQKALKPARLALALRRPVLVPDFEAVYQAVRELLYKRLRACLGLGQKAGAVVSGYTLLCRACAQGRVLYMILAADTEIGRAEVYRSWCVQYNIPYVTLFTKEELGQLIGKANRSALGLTAPHFLALLCPILASLARLQMADDRS